MDTSRTFADHVELKGLLMSHLVFSAGWRSYETHLMESLEAELPACLGTIILHMTRMAINIILRKKYSIDQNFQNQNAA